MKTYNFIFEFLNINTEQKTYIINLFNDYSWPHGLAVINSEIKEDGNKLKISFQSSKKAIAINGYSYIEKKFNFLEKLKMYFQKSNDNILECILGKEQIISNMYFQNIGIENCDCLFTDHNNFKYKIEISKRGDLVKIVE